MTEINRLEEAEIKREDRRSGVRIWVTYFATAFIFGGGGFLMWISKKGCGFNEDAFSAAKEIFTMVMPVATGIVTYWFASRKPKPKPDDSAPKDKGNTET